MKDACHEIYHDNERSFFNTTFTMHNILNLNYKRHYIYICTSFASRRDLGFLALHAAFELLTIPIHTRSKAKKKKKKEKIKDVRIGTITRSFDFEVAARVYIVQKRTSERMRKKRS